MSRKTKTNTCSFNSKEEILFLFSLSGKIPFSFFVKKQLQELDEYKKFKEEYLKEHPELDKSYYV